MSEREIAYRIFGDLPLDYEVDEFDPEGLPYHLGDRGGCGHYHRPFEECPDEDGSCGVIGCCH